MISLGGLLARERVNKKQEDGDEEKRKGGREGVKGLGNKEGGTKRLYTLRAKLTFMLELLPKEYVYF